MMVSKMVLGAAIPQPWDGSGGAIPSHQPASLVPNAADPAYVKAASVKEYLILLEELVGAGKGSGVQWKSMEDTSKGKSVIPTIQVPLDDILKRTKWTDAEPSKRLKEAVETVIEVCPILIVPFLSVLRTQSC